MIPCLRDSTSLENMVSRGVLRYRGIVTYLIVASSSNALSRGAAEISLEGTSSLEVSRGSMVIHELGVPWNSHGVVMA